MATVPPTTANFPGFGIPEQNWFRMPNEWTDLTAEINSLAELKVVEYVLRHTWGYQEYGFKKHITLDEFMNGRKRNDGTRMDKGTGLSKPSVITGLKQAVEQGLLLEEVDDTDRARVKKYYSLRMKPDREAQNGGGVKDLNADVKNFDIGSKTSLPRTEKDTLERHLEKQQHSDDTVVALVKFGITEKVAQYLVSHHPKATIYQQLDYHEFELATAPQKITSPRGRLRTRIEENWSSPDGYAQDWRERLAAKTIEAERARQNQQTLEAALMSQEGTKRQEQEQLRQERLAAVKSHYNTSGAEEKIWTAVKSELLGKIREAEYKTFVTGSELLAANNQQVVLWVRHSFLAKTMEKRYGLVLKQLLAKHLGVTVDDLKLDWVYPQVSEKEP